MMQRSSGSLLPRSHAARTHAARARSQQRTSAAAAAPKASSSPIVVTTVGKGGVGKTHAALALSISQASQNKRVLYLSTHADASPEYALQMPPPTRLPTTPTAAAPELGLPSTLFLQRIESTALLDDAYEEAKKADADFGISTAIKTATNDSANFELPKKKTIPLVAGMDPWLLLGYLLRRVIHSDKYYDVVVVDGLSTTEAARLAATPVRAKWLSERARDEVKASDAGRIVLPTVEMAASSVLTDNATTGGNSDYERLRNLLDDAADLVTNPKRFIGVLVTQAGNAAASDAAARAWGALAIAGAPCGAVWMRGGEEDDGEKFSPLVSIATADNASLSDLVATVPDSFLDDAVSTSVPPPLEVSSDCLRVHLPLVPKTDVKVSLSGSEVVVEACGSRRAIPLPAGRSKVAGAKADNNVLEIKLE